MTRYILRLDDSSPYQDPIKWKIIEEMLDKYGVKPLVGVIPFNKDPSMVYHSKDIRFWDKVKSWQSKGWSIALHGYTHKLLPCQVPSMVPINNVSEFANDSLEVQKEKLKKAVSIFNEHSIIPEAWIAPAHGFTPLTLKALYEVTSIRKISDGIALSSFSFMDFTWIPQQLWWYRFRPFGLWTICLHPNNMSEKRIKAFVDCLQVNHLKFIAFNECQQTSRRRNIFDYFYSFMFWLNIRLKRFLKSYK